MEQQNRIEDSIEMWVEDVRQQQQQQEERRRVPARPKIKVVGEHRARYIMRKNPDYDWKKEDGDDNRKYLYEPTHSIAVPNNNNDDVAAACHQTLLLKQKCLRYYIALALFLSYVIYFVYFAESMKVEWKDLQSVLNKARKAFNRSGGPKKDNV